MLDVHKLRDISDVWKVLFFVKTFLKNVQRRKQL